MKEWTRHHPLSAMGDDSVAPDDFSEIELVDGAWWRHLVAGGLAGAVSRTFTAPLDRIKVFFQVHRNVKSIYGCYQDMLKEGGYYSLWRGNGINVLKIAPESALKFSAYEQVKTLFHDSHIKTELKIYERFAAGCIAGAFAQSVIYPLEVLKTRMALRNSGQFHGVWNAAVLIYRAEGIRSFYRGFVPNLCGILPYAGIDLTLYETLKRYALPEEKDRNRPNIFVILVCGTISSTCGQLTSYPFSLVRTRLQAPTVSQADSMTSEFKRILQNDGFIGLYKGMTASFLKVIPSVCISYVVYEFWRGIFGVKMT